SGDPKLPQFVEDIRHGCAESQKIEAGDTGHGGEDQLESPAQRLEASGYVKISQGKGESVQGSPGDIDDDSQGGQKQENQGDQHQIPVAEKSDPSSAHDEIAVDRQHQYGQGNGTADHAHAEGQYGVDEFFPGID